MRIAVPKETIAGERRVALIPDSVAKLKKAGYEVTVERGAGAAAGFPDTQYEAAGATLTGAPWGDGGVLLSVQRPGAEQAGQLAEGSVLIGLLAPSSAGEFLELLARRRVTSFAMELVPRITRAQSMDVLSSQATLAGYKAVLLAAASLGRVLPMLTTAAGTLAPARAFVLGAGVAGLQAIATARRLGAVVSAFDVRPAVKEQVQSLGATFVEAEVAAAEGAGGYARELAKEPARTGAGPDPSSHHGDGPGDHHRRDPRPAGPGTGDRGDGAGDEARVGHRGPGRRVGRQLRAHPGRGDRRAHGVTIIGAVNLPATVPQHASQMYSRNLTTFLEHLVKEGQLVLDLNDPIAGPMCLTHDGVVRAGRSAT